MRRILETISLFIGSAIVCFGVVWGVIDFLDFQGIPWLKGQGVLGVAVVLLFSLNVSTIVLIATHRLVLDVDVRGTVNSEEVGMADTNNERVNIAGAYYAGGNRNHRVDISRIRGNFYRVENPDWKGVGLFDGEFYYGVFKFNDDPTPIERGGNWGAHRARFRLGDESFELFGIELTGKRDYDRFEGSWDKAQ